MHFWAVLLPVGLGRNAVLDLIGRIGREAACKLNQRRTVGGKYRYNVLALGGTGYKTIFWTPGSH